ncbi:MAG TPA: hypothetical protein DGB85_03170 [Deltaproteobacteria bacterium]|nr:hypothetical protein [Deltaproteobacteria bacterium]
MALKIDCEGLGYRYLCAYFLSGPVHTPNSGPTSTHQTKKAEDLKQFQRLNNRLIGRALKMGGTCTGKHRASG